MGLAGGAHGSGGGGRAAVVSPSAPAPPDPRTRPERPTPPERLPYFYTISYVLYYSVLLYYTPIAFIHTIPYYSVQPLGIWASQGGSGVWAGTGSEAHNRTPAMADTPAHTPLTISDRYYMAKSLSEDPTLEKPLKEVCDGPPGAADFLADFVEELEPPCEEAVCCLVDKCMAGGFQPLVDAFEKGNQTPAHVASRVLVDYLLTELRKSSPTEELEALGWWMPGENPATAKLVRIVCQFWGWTCDSIYGKPIPYTQSPESFCWHLMVYAALIAQDIWASAFARRQYYTENAIIARRGIEEEKDSKTIALDFIKDGPTEHLNERECNLVMGHIESLLDYGNDLTPKRRRRNAVDER